MYPNGEILVADNIPQRRAQIVQILTDEGFAVLEAAEGLAALRAVKSRRVALIIAATGLRGSLDGVATVRCARQRQPWLKALYIGEVAHPSANLDPDRDDVIAGPFERYELLGCTFEVLQRGAATGARDLACRARTELKAS
jgi:two-component system, OmpR family, response regulator MprA